MMVGDLRRSVCSRPVLGAMHLITKHSPAWTEDDRKLLRFEVAAPSQLANEGQITSRRHRNGPEPIERNRVRNIDESCCRRPEQIQEIGLRRLPDADVINLLPGDRFGEPRPTR